MGRLIERRLAYRGSTPRLLKLWDCSLAWAKRHSDKVKIIGSNPFNPTSKASRGSSKEEHLSYKQKAEISKFSLGTVGESLTKSPVAARRR